MLIRARRVSIFSVDSPAGFLPKLALRKEGLTGDLNSVRLWDRLALGNGPYEVAVGNWSNVSRRWSRDLR